MSVLKFLKRFRRKDPVIITPFGGYANDHMLHVQARVLEDEGIREAEEDSLLRTLYNSFKRFESDEISNAIVIARWKDQEKTLLSDNEGYVYLDKPHGLVLDHADILWLPVSFSLLENDLVAYEVTTTVMKPGTGATYGIISDIDDTVIHTGVVSWLKWRLLVNSFMKHSYKRMPLEGTADFYTLLHKGKNGHDSNPFFYVSNSPWNLYLYLQTFLRKFNFPEGALLLRDMAISLRRKKSFLEGNKYRKAVHILETYPALPFILIGDAAESDADIYLHLALTYPNRILAIYIRTVTHAARLRRIEKLIEQNTGIEMILVKSSAEAIDHARSRGYIAREDKP